MAPVNLKNQQNLGFTLLCILILILPAGCQKSDKTKKAACDDQSNKIVQSQLDHQEEVQSTPLEVSAQQGSVKSIKLIKEQVFNSTEEIIIGRIASFSVDEQNRVYIADMDQSVVLVFNENGSFSTTIGRQGRGPAEFSAVSPTTNIRIKSNKLYVPDFTNPYDFFPTRIQVFDLENLQFVQTIKLIAENRNNYDLKGYFPFFIYPRDDGLILTGYRRFPDDYKDAVSFIRYFLQDTTGNIVSGPVIEQKDRRNLTYEVTGVAKPYLAVHSFPFFGKSLLAVSENDHIYTVRSEVFKIDIHDPFGNHINSFGHPFERKKFDKDLVIKRYEQANYGRELGDGVTVKMIRQANNLPEKWPALMNMFFDDKNRLWVSTIIEDHSVYEWWVLDKTGEILFKFKWPRNKPVKVVKNGYLYTKKTNDKTGAEHIVRYRIKFEE